MKIKLSLKLSEFCITPFAIVTVVIALGLLAYLFTKLTGHDSLFGFLRLLDVGEERSIPTYVSVINLLLGSILIFIIYGYEKANNQSGAGYWLFLSILFLYLSVDESASIHENFRYVYRYLVRKEIISPILSTNEWLPFGVFFIFAVSIVLLPFVRKLPTDTRRYFLIAGCVFVTGAVGFEYLAALMREAGIDESRPHTVRLVKLLEEGFEMYGVAIFNCALYREILRRKISVIIGG